MWRVLGNILCDLDFKVKVMKCIYLQKYLLTIGRPSFELYRCIGDLTKRVLGKFYVSLTPR